MTEDSAIERSHTDHFEHLKRYEAEAAASERRAKARRRRVRRIPSLWVRLTALAVFLVAIMVGMVGLTIKAVRPYHEAGVASRQLATTRQQIAGLDRSNAGLQRAITYLNTPDGVASEAHHMGYLRPGERPLVIEGVPGPVTEGDALGAAPSAAPDATSSKPVSLFQRFWHHLLDL